MISGGLISNNTSEIAGGGVTVEGTSILAINCGTIEGNSSFSGGGMFVDVKSKIIILSCSIHNNTATNGGGIYTVDETYKNLTSSS